MSGLMERLEVQVVYGYILLLILLPAFVSALFFMGGYLLLGSVLLVGNYIPIFCLIRGFLKRSRGRD